MEAIIFNFENGEIDKGQKNVQISTGESSCKGQVSNRRLQSRDQREFDRRPQTLTREIIQMRLKREVYYFQKHRNCHQQAVIVTTNLKLTVIVTTSTVIVTTSTVIVTNFKSKTP